jgi:NAD(P)-dependent dehydrogenase (short-subunit alcohol dehydrogenase family)
VTGRARAGPRPVALVTGASRGLGEVLARELAGEGYELVLTARNAPALARVAESLRPWGLPVETLAGDVTDPVHRGRLKDAIDRRTGLDLLVNNAAVLGPTPLPPLLEAKDAELEHVYRVNVVAPVAVIRTLRPALAARHGLVVNISSDAAVGGYPGWGNYGASKAALDLASHTLANELESEGIAVVSVDPGDMRTPGAEPAFAPEEFHTRPLPEVTGHRFQAQAEHWGVRP